MNKTDFTNKLAENMGSTKKDADTLVNTFLDTLTEGLIADEKVQLTGFGSFELRQRKERTGVNPQTGEEIVIPSKKAVAFKPSKNLKDTVNEGGITIG